MDLDLYTRTTSVMCVQRLNWFLRAPVLQFRHVSSHRSSVPRILRQVSIASADRTTSSPDPTGYPRPPDDGSSVAVCALAIYTFFLQQRRSHHEVSLEDSALPYLPLYVIPVCPVCSSSHGYVHAIPPCGHIVDTWEVPPPVRVNVSPIEVQPPVRVNVSPIEVQPPVRVNLSLLESRERQVGLRDPSVDHCMRDAGLFPAEFNVRTSMTGLLRSTVCFIVAWVQRSVTCSGSHACGPGTDAVRFIAPVRTEPPWCPAPPWPTNTELPSGCSNPYIDGESCTYRCRPGYTQVSGSTVRTCSNEAWTGTDLVCTGGRNCTTPPNPANSNAYVTGCSYPYTNGEKCYYRCRPGYMRLIGDTIRACYIHWTGTDLFCVLDLRPGIDRCAETAPRLPGPTCHAPPTPAYTSMSGCSSPYIFNEKCTYQCLPGYTQVSGSTVRTCYYGHWTGTDLFCSNGQNCPTPANIPYTYRTGCSSPYNNGDRCSYQCRPEFMRASGSINRTCSNGTWTGTNLICWRGGHLRACVDSLGVLSSVGSVV
ncbi:hypothetical protein Bbelb_159240 [Branchiostoma belcheri]|nr:hypothetical protein Bbelb_159240 [Branchiostoma belcheri]